MIRQKLVAAVVLSKKAGSRAWNSLELGQTWDKGAHVRHDHALDTSASLQ